MDETMAINRADSWLRRRSAASSAWDEAAFEAVFRRHYPRVVAVLRRVVGDAGQAEELAGELFWKLYRQPPPDREHLGGWLYRGAVQDGIDALRARRRRQHYEAESPPPYPPAGADPEREFFRRQQLLAVHQVLAALKPAQAQLLLLRHCGFSYRELAAVMNLQPGSIGTLLARAESAFEQAWLRLEAANQGD